MNKPRRSGQNETKVFAYFVNAGARFVLADDTLRVCMLHFRKRDRVWLRAPELTQDGQWRSHRLWHCLLHLRSVRLEFRANKFIDHTAIAAELTRIPQGVVGLLTAGAEGEEVSNAVLLLVF